VNLADTACAEKCDTNHFSPHLQGLAPDFPGKVSYDNHNRRALATTTPAAKQVGTVWIDPCQNMAFLFYIDNTIEYMFHFWSDGQIGRLM
jgi:hypothetical protein